MTTKTKEKKSDPCPCPACGKMLTSRKAVPKHTNGCPEWEKKFPDTPPKEFNFHAFYKTGFWEDGFEEGVNFVRCQICYEQGIDYRKTRILHHVKSEHKLTKEQYLTLYPEALTSCSSTNAKRVATVQKRFGVDNVFQAEEIKEKFDVRETAWNDEAREKRAETNLERYGHETSLGGEEGHQRAVEGMLKAYGVENPAHVPEIQEQKRLTNYARYGDWYVRTDEFKEKSRETCLERYGVDHFMKTEEGVARVKETLRDRYGVESPMHVDEFVAKQQATMRERYPKGHPLRHAEPLAKRRDTCRELYGVYNVSQNPEVKARIKEVWVEKYGVPFPPQSVRNHFESPNKLEQLVDSWSDRLYFTGDGKVYLTSETYGKAKNPDFVVVPSRA